MFRNNWIKIFNIHIILRGTTQFRIMSMAGKISESGIWNFINILVKLCNSPYIINHVTRFSKFGKQESLESSQESWNQVNIPKDLESCRWKSVVSDSLHNTQSDMRKPCLCSYKQVKCMLLLDIIKSVTLIQ